MFAPGDSDRSSFIPGSSGVEEFEVASEELFVSKEDEADEGRDTTMYFCMGREAPSPAPVPGSSLTKGCRVEVVVVLVTGDADWEELMVITCGGLVMVSTELSASSRDRKIFFWEEIKVLVELRQLLHWFP